MQDGARHERVERRLEQLSALLGDAVQGVQQAQRVQHNRHLQQQRAVTVHNLIIEIVPLVPSVVVAAELGAHSFPGVG